MPGAGLSLTLEGLVDVERRLARLADQLGDESYHTELRTQACQYSEFFAQR